MNEDDNINQSSRNQRWSIANNRHPLQKISQNHQRTIKNTIYLKEEKDENETFTYIFPVAEAILLNVMQIYQPKIVEIYEEEDIEADNKKYFAVCQPEYQTKQILSSFQKLYNVEQYGRFLGRYCEIISEKNSLPEYIWVKNVPNLAKKIKADLNGYNIIYSYLRENFLIQNTKSKQRQLQVVIQSIQTDNQSQNKQIIYLSRFLLIELSQNEVNLQRFYSFIEIQLNIKNIYRCFHPDSRIEFIIQSENLIDMLNIKSILLIESIPYKYISQAQYLKKKPNFILSSEKSNYNLNFDLNRATKSLKNSDILKLEMLLNTNQQQFIKQIEFMLDNWSIYQHHYEEDMEQLQDLFMAYIKEDKKQSQNEEDAIMSDFYSCSKRYTSVTHHAGKIIPKIKKINQYQGKFQGVLKQISVNKYNNTFANFVNNTIFIATRKGTVILGQNKIPLTQLIANQPEYQSKSRRAARWQHFFSFVGNNHYLQIRNFQQKGKQTRQQYMREINNKVLLDLSCLGCCKFFYDGQNIRDSEINQTPFKIIESASKIEICPKQIKQAMRYFMNQSGGIILFDSVLRHREVITKGIPINLQRQRQITTLLQSYFKQQVDKDSDSDIKKQMIVSFVPVFKNPLKHKKRVHITETINQEAATRFVTRVKIDRKLVKPKYFDKRQQIQHQRQLRQRDFLGPKISCFHSWSCEDPEFVQPKKEKKKKPVKQQPKPLKQIYKYISLMLDKKQDRQLKIQIENKKLGKLAILANSGHFKCAVHLKVLYHNTQLQTIRQTIRIFLQSKHRAKQGKQDDKKQKVVSFTEVNNMIWLPDRSKSNAMLTIDDYKDIVNEDTVKNIFLEEEVVYWQFDTKLDGKKQYFFYIKDKEKCIYLYYVLNNYSQKAKFKLPDGWQSFSQNEIKNRFKLIFNSNQGVKSEIKLKEQLYKMFKMKKMRQTSFDFNKQ